MRHLEGHQVERVIWEIPKAVVFEDDASRFWPSAFLPDGLARNRWEVNTLEFDGRERCRIIDSNCRSDTRRYIIGGEDVLSRWYLNPVTCRLSVI
jgi:hypothetical protein